MDINIPQGTYRQSNTYALIIGNEDYKSRQTGLRAEQNVDFAENDAKVFASYCEKTLGIAPAHIKLLKNATSAEMQQALSWIENLARLDEGKAKLIFYYSGHGLPDDANKDAYIIPVDVAGNNLDYALKLADVYQQLSKYPAKRVTVFIDACFSGGARNEGLIAMKLARIKPRKNEIKGNFVVFSSSTGDQTSAVYRDKQHGYFTYFLLKKLQETKGNVDYKTLSKYISSSVEKQTALRSIEQSPQLSFSMEIAKLWGAWRLVD